MSENQNCWEYKKCGREPRGNNAGRLGICPAATETRLDSVHDGTNGGRSCWVVAGTLCQGKVQGVFAQKYATCQDCDFYKKVQNENYSNFQVSVSLLQLLR
ncbi:MAG: two-CW domain-containing protein [Desulfobulbaceae bacterium]